MSQLRLRHLRKNVRVKRAKKTRSRNESSLLHISLRAAILIRTETNVVLVVTRTAKTKKRSQFIVTGTEMFRMN